MKEKEQAYTAEELEKEKALAEYAEKFKIKDKELFGQKEIEELEESFKESKRQTKERTDGPLDNFSKDLKNSIKKRTYINHKEHGEDITYENEEKKK